MQENAFDQAISSFQDGKVKNLIRISPPYIPPLFAGGVLGEWSLKIRADTRGDTEC